MESVVDSHDVDDFFDRLVLCDVKRLDARSMPFPLLRPNASRTQSSIWLVMHNFWRKHYDRKFWSEEDSRPYEFHCTSLGVTLDTRDSKVLYVTPGREEMKAASEERGQRNTRIPTLARSPRLHC